MNYNPTLCSQCPSHKVVTWLSSCNQCVTPLLIQKLFSFASLFVSPWYLTASTAFLFILTSWFHWFVPPRSLNLANSIIFLNLFWFVSQDSADCHWEPHNGQPNQMISWPEPFSLSETSTLLLQIPLMIECAVMGINDKKKMKKPTSSNPLWPGRWMVYGLYG